MDNDEIGTWELEREEVRGRFDGIEIGFYFLEELQAGRRTSKRASPKNALSFNSWQLARRACDAKGKEVYDKAFEQAFKATMARKPPGQ